MKYPVCYFNSILFYFYIYIHKQETYGSVKLLWKYMFKKTFSMIKKYKIKIYFFWWVFSSFLLLWLSLSLVEKFIWYLFRDKGFQFEKNSIFWEIYLQFVLGQRILLLLSVQEEQYILVKKLLYGICLEKKDIIRQRKKLVCYDGYVS